MMLERLGLKEEPGPLSLLAQIERLTVKPNYAKRARLNEVYMAMKGREMTNTDLVELLGISRSTATQYLRLLQAENVAVSRVADDRRVYYRLRNDA